MDIEKLADELYDRLSERMVKSSKHNRTDKGTGNLELGQIIRAYRGTESLREVGSVTGLHHGFIGRLERGERGASVETLARLTGYFGTDFALDYLNAVLGLVDPGQFGPTIIAGQPENQGGALDQAGDAGGDADLAAALSAASRTFKDNMVRAFNMESEQKYAVHR